MLRPVGPDHYKLIRLDFGFCSNFDNYYSVYFLSQSFSLRHYPLIVKKNTEYRP